MSTALYVAEIGALRGEVNSIIDRMNGNENFSAGSISAIFAFVSSTEINVASLLLALLTLLITIIGIFRYIDLNARLKAVDAYLLFIEKEISSDGGWTTQYYSSTDKPYGIPATRNVFWAALGAVSVLGTLFVVGQILSAWSFR